MVCHLYLHLFKNTLFHENTLNESDLQDDIKEKIKDMFQRK